VSRQQAQKKICLDFVRAFFNSSVWLQAGQYLALAAQIPAKQKSGCPRLARAFSAHHSSFSRFLLEILPVALLRPHRLSAARRCLSA
jgi:hypothetical protein